jgi:hypothetical protein
MPFGFVMVTIPFIRWPGILNGRQAEVLWLLVKKAA